jgi:hypothetical protein
LWGWQLQIPLSVLGVAGSLLLVCATPLDWRRWLGAVGAATVATYSFSNGVLVWPIGLAVLIGRRARPAASLGWALAGAVALGLFFHGYVRPEDPWRALADRPNLVRYVLAYLGGAVEPVQRRAVDAGALGLFALSGLAALVAFSRSFAAALPGLALGAYALASAILTGLGRAPLGVQQAQSSRYITISMLLWIGCVLLLSRALAGRGLYARAAAALLVAPLVTHLYTAAHRGVARATSDYQIRLAARQSLLTADGRYLDRLWPNRSELLERREVLRRLQLSVFRPGATGASGR